ncbi:aminoglycoside phosphotransferase family protein [Pseudidiomarina insulisalsae]|uniref:aminoglycoside phosphotransferase family protein n=1 Tax=Pseudidiomarina insulisalsae TaxID=575789 RepID=UPI0013003A71|nr:phosphotransferase [Pseudidiomarina insulisalsae]
MENKRELQLQAWCESVIGQSQQDLQPVFGDARPWRYYRITDGVRSFIAVDTKNTAIAMDNYRAVADAYREHGMQVPGLIAEHQQHGFMLMTDLGSSLLLSHLRESTLTQWYPKVYPQMAEIMQVRETARGPLPEFNEALLREELALMADWLFREHLQLMLTTAEQQIWRDFCDALVANALAQPQVGVHRKFHARNILVQPDESLAVTGFHDAAIGPITYDAVSLLRDCYVSWPAQIVAQLSTACYDYLRQIREDVAVSPAVWQRWFDLMGLQRHCYVCGLFARRCERDGNPGYLQDIPRNLAYLQEVAVNYAEFDEFREFLTERVMPAVAAVNK